MALMIQSGSTGTHLQQRPSLPSLIHIIPNRCASARYRFIGHFMVTVGRYLSLPVVALLLYTWVW
jgi:hypothetical protein